MRKMGYKTMFKMDDYVISIPDGQSGKIEIELIHGYYWRSNHIGITAEITDFVNPVTFDDNTSPKLKKNYRQIFRAGRWKSWHITEIRIEPGYISVDICNRKRKKACFSITLIEPESHLKFAIKAPALDGRIETYVVEMGTHRCRDRDGELTFFRDMVIEEPCDIGRKRIVFENGIPSKGRDEDWFEVLIHEWR